MSQGLAQLHVAAHKTGSQIILTVIAIGINGKTKGGILRIMITVGTTGTGNGLNEIGRDGTAAASSIRTPSGVAQSWTYRVMYTQIFRS